MLIFNYSLEAFYFFSNLKALTTTSSTMLNKSSETGYSCLISYLTEKAFNLFPLSKIWAVGLSGWLLWCRGIFLLYPVFFPDLAKLSMFSYSSLNFLKNNYLSSSLVNHISSCLWDQLLKIYCDPLVDLKFWIAVLSSEVAVNSSNIY